MVLLSSPESELDLVNGICGIVGDLERPFERPVKGPR